MFKLTRFCQFTLKYFLVSVIMGVSIGASIISATPNTIPSSSTPSHTLHTVTPQEWWLRITLTLPDGWHTYWQNPGDVGLAPTFQWDASHPLTFSEIVYSPPTRFETDGIVSYGYEHMADFYVKASTDTSLTTPITVTLNAAWLICKTDCIPTSSTVAIQLFPDSRPPKSDSIKLHSLPLNALTITPISSPPQWPIQTEIITANQENGHVIITIPNQDPLAKLDLFPLSDTVKVTQRLTTTSTSNHQLQSSSAPLTFILTLNSVAIPAQDILIKQIHPDKSVTWRQLHIQIPLSANNLLDHSDETSWWVYFGFAFLGGVILNIMPCVFPVLSIKLIHLINTSPTLSDRVTSSLSYTAGILLSMACLGGVVGGLKQAGIAVGWGFQMQSPVFISVMMVILIGVSASLLDWLKVPVWWLEFTAHVSTRLQSKATQSAGASHARSQFFVGILAVILSTPCTAPFMGAALGFGLSQPFVSMMSILLSLGLGLAAPFVVLSMSPMFIKFMPKPGKWMVIFKRLMVIPILITLIWLGWVLHRQLSPTDTAQSTFSPTQIEQALENGPVLVNVTADWCLTCQTNKWILKSADVQAFFRDQKVTIITADWTQYDPEISRYLSAFNRQGVPAYVLYRPGHPPKVLPELLTKDILRSMLTDD